ncbi:hypothetical protein Btru_063724 [Bulinus truncatus]|nr:hypothetical protein Btru_063724 [Bulinus truncatus]
MWTGIDEWSMWTVIDDRSVWTGIDDRSVWAVIDDRSVWTVIDDRSVWTGIDDRSVWTVIDDRSLWTVIDDRSVWTGIDDRSVWTVIDDRSLWTGIDDRSVWTVIDDRSVWTGIDDRSVWTVIDDRSLWTVIDDRSVWTGIDDRSVWTVIDDRSLWTGIDDRSVWTVIDDRSVWTGIDDRSVWTVIDDRSLWTVIDDRSVWTGIDDRLHLRVCSDTILLYYNSGLGYNKRFFTVTDYSPPPSLLTTGMMTESTKGENSTSNAASNGNKNNTTYCTPDKPARSVRAMSLAEDYNRWIFIKKLMAIEEEHDRRRKERERLKELEKDSLTKCDREKDDVTKIDTSDSLSRWINSQVLDDNPEDSQIQDSLFTTEVLHKTKCLPIKPDADRVDLVSPRSFPLETRSWVSLPSIASPAPHGEDGRTDSPKLGKKRQLRLPPILLPRVYSVAPRPLQYREFMTPTTVRGPITDAEWEDLKYCRYIRQAAPRFAVPLTPTNLSSSFQF